MTLAGFNSDMSEELRGDAEDVLLLGMPKVRASSIASLLISFLKHWGNTSRTLKFQRICDGTCGWVYWLGTVLHLVGLLFVAFHIKVWL